MISKFTRGMVYWMTLPSGCGDNVQSGRRPCIIVSNDIGNLFSNNITIVPCTTNLTKENTQPTHYKTKLFSNLESIVLCEDIHTVSKKLTEEFIGVLDTQTMKEIDKCLAVALNIQNIQPSVPSIPIEEKSQESSTRIIVHHPAATRISTKAQKTKFIKEYEEQGVDYVLNKYHITTKTAAYQRYIYYKNNKK